MVNTNLRDNSTGFTNCLLETAVVVIVVVSVIVGTVIQQRNGYVCNPGKLFLSFE